MTFYIYESQKIERGRSRGLDLIYQPIKDHHMSRSIKNFQTDIHELYTMKVIFILKTQHAPYLLNVLFT